MSTSTKDLILVAEPCENRLSTDSASPSPTHTSLNLSVNSTPIQNNNIIHSHHPDPPLIHTNISQITNDTNIYYAEYTQQPHNNSHIHHYYQNQNAYQQTIRIVSQKECNAMKRNFILLLKENNGDEKEEFNQQDFINIFKKILPNSPDQEVRKLFHILHGADYYNDNNVYDDTKTLSFNGMLNNPQNFTQLLHSMGCISEEEHQSQQHQQQQQQHQQQQQQHQQQQQQQENINISDNNSNNNIHNGHCDDDDDGIGTIDYGTDTVQAEAEEEDTEIYDDEAGFVMHLHNNNNSNNNNNNNNHLSDNNNNNNDLYFSNIASNISSTVMIHDTPPSNTDDTVFGGDEEIPQLPSSARHTTRSKHNVPAMPALDENDILIPQLSWRQQIYVKSTPNLGADDSHLSVGGHGHHRNGSNTTLDTYTTLKTARSEMHGMGKSVKNVNSINYNEYINYQKEQIMELKQKINDLNNFELKYNELQLILDGEHKKINNLNEEIKQLNEDKNDLYLENEKIQNQYNLLLERFKDLNDYRKISEIQHESTQFIMKELDQLHGSWHEYQTSNSKMVEEKQKLNTLNNQFTQINEHLRNELEKEKRKTEKLKDLINKKDEEIRNITIDLLSKEQLIDSLQNTNDDLSNQLNLYQAPSTRFVGGNHSRKSSIDWKYGPSVFTASRRGSQCLEFDMFQDLNPSQRHIGSPRQSDILQQAPILNTRTSKLRINTPINDWYNYSIYTQSLQSINTNNNNNDNKDVIIKLNEDLSNNKIEEEKIYQQEYDKNDNLLLIKKIKELEIELEQYQNMEDILRKGFEQYHYDENNVEYDKKRKKRKKKIKTKEIGVQTINPGFWQRLLAEIQCVPNGFE